MDNGRQLCTFYVNDVLFGLPVVEVQEVIRSQLLTFVPQAHFSVSGLMNLRGCIVTAIDLRRRLALPAAAREATVNVVLRAAAGQVSLLVDKIGDVVLVDEENFEALPFTVPAETRELMRGAYKLSTGLLLELRPDKVIDIVA